MGDIVGIFGKYCHVIKAMSLISRSQIYKTIETGP